MCISKIKINPSFQIFHWISTKVNIVDQFINSVCTKRSLIRWFTDYIYMVYNGKTTFKVISILDHALDKHLSGCLHVYSEMIMTNNYVSSETHTVKLVLKCHYNERLSK